MIRKLIMILVIGVLSLGSAEKRKVYTWGTIQDKRVERGLKGETQTISLKKELTDGYQHIMCMGAIGKHDPNFSQYREGDEIWIRGLTDASGDLETVTMVVYPCAVTDWKSKGR